MIPQARVAKASRRTAPKPLLEEDVVTKRARGEISCAECKRLKLKCDKVNCIKKEQCEYRMLTCNLRNCPVVLVFVEDARLFVHKATSRLGRRRGVLYTDFHLKVRLTKCRFVLTDTDKLHQKIAEMSQRIRQLEDALAIFQSGVSTATHPLLRDELLSIKLGPEARPPQETQSLEESTEDPVTDTIDAFGTLTIGDGGESSYFGRSGGSEVCLQSRRSLSMPK